MIECRTYITAIAGYGFLRQWFFGHSGFPGSQIFYETLQEFLVDLIQSYPWIVSLQTYGYRMYMINKGTASFFLSKFGIFVEPFYQRYPGFVRKDCHRLFVSDVKNTLRLNGIGSLKRVDIPFL